MMNFLIFLTQNIFLNLFKIKNIKNKQKIISKFGVKRIKIIKIKTFKF